MRSQAPGSPPSDSRRDRPSSQRKRSETCGRVDAIAHIAWRWSLACFVLAAGTGAWLRFGMLHGLPAGLHFGDVRHAHSHLMFFGWVTPALIALVATALGRAGLRLPGLSWLLGGAFVAALMSFPPFLTSGYRETPLFDRELPLSMMTSGLNGIVWIAFIVLYLLATRRGLEAERKPTEGTRHEHASESPSAHAEVRAGLPWFDAAVFLLAMSTLGIAGLAATGMSGLMEPRLAAGLVDFFLTLFGEGWFAAGLLGLAHVSRRVAPPPRASRRGMPQLGVPGRSVSPQNAAPQSVSGRTEAYVAPVVLLAGGLALRTTAELLLTAGMVHFGFVVIGRVTLETLEPWLAIGVSLGHLAVGTGLVWAVLDLLAPRRGAGTRVAAIWIPALLFLLAKGAVEIGLALPAMRIWVDTLGLRILLLHAFLLGGVSVGLVAAAGDRFGRTPATIRWSWTFLAGVLLLLGALVPLTGLWPADLRGVWSLQLAAFAGTAPVAAGLGLLISNLRRPDSAFESR